MRVAFHTGVESSHMFVATHVFLAFILVGTLRFAAKERRAGREVMDISEAKTFRYLVIRRIANRAVHANG